MTLVLDPSRREAIEEKIKLFRLQKIIALFTGKDGLLNFVKYFWHILEPQTKFVDGWPLHAICLHLQAVTYGEITRLLINVPPGFMKSLLTDVFWPAWEWAIYGSHLRYVTFSYSASLTERDNRRFGALVTCQEYQELFGDKIRVVKLGDRMVSNTATGWKLASSVGGVGTGERGDRVILDDPHNVKEAESEIIRAETVRWFRESMSNRLNDMETGAIIIIMQRLHEDDVSGVVLEKGMAYVHLMVPMVYDYERQTDEEFSPVMTPVGWYDPRYDDYDPNSPTELLAWPERFPDRVWEAIQVDIGPYAVAGQYEQSPTPRGGGIFRREWWQLWESKDGKFPAFDYLIASLDSAFTEKERNDPSALTIWGIFRNQEDKNRVMLVHAWRKFLQFSGPRNDVRPGESRMDWIQRTQKEWGLVEWVKYSCERFKVDNLLIEAKANGISAAQELSNRYGRLSFGVQLMQVRGSKEARALAAQPTFSQMLVYAPAREWAEDVITEMSVFPKGKFKDLTDSTTMAIRYLRDGDLLVDDAEHDSRVAESVMHHGKKTELSFW